MDENSEAPGTGLRRLPEASPGNGPIRRIERDLSERAVPRQEVPAAA